MEFDLFELTKLPFDFYTYNSKEHDEAIKAIKKSIFSIEGELNCTSPDYKPLLMAKRNFLKSFLSEDKSTLLVNEYEIAKRIKIQVASDIFRKILNLLPKLVFAEQYVKVWSDKTGLSEFSVSAILKTEGFQINRFEIITPELPERAVLSDVENKLDYLRRYGKDNADSHLEFLKDIYDLIAIFDDNPGNSDDYRNSDDHQQLHDILKKYVSEKCGYQPTPIDAMVQIASTAILAIFDRSDKTKKVKYDNYLKYCHPNVMEIRSILKIIPDDIKRIPEFADSKIDELCPIFGENALGVYNDLAGLLKKGKQPYIPIFKRER